MYIIKVNTTMLSGNDRIIGYCSDENVAKSMASKLNDEYKRLKSLIDSKLPANTLKAMKILEDKLITDYDLSSYYFFGNKKDIFEYVYEEIKELK